jgi:hypothetical protein
MISDSLVAEFITALEEEIAELQSGKSGRFSKIYNGRFLRKVPEGFAYLFNLENFLATLDDVPAEIQVENKKCKAQVLMSQGMEVEEKSPTPFYPVFA